MPSESPLTKVRSLRDVTKQIGSTLESDLGSFLHTIDKVTFRRVPVDRSVKDDISTTVTASALMALSLCNKLQSFYRGKDREACESIYTRLAKFKWTSSGLPESNAFTATLILRSLRFVGADRTAGSKKDATSVDARIARGPLSAALQGKTYQEIASVIAEKALDGGLRVMDYPLSPAIVYWFLDAVDGLNVTLVDSWWTRLAAWATGELARQISLIASDYTERMDPIAMAMAACIAQRLRNIGQTGKISKRGELEENLPSQRELRHAIKVLFAKQLESGVWNKYFPLFHYPGAGSNYCYVFEMLEAILHEFKSDPVLEDEGVFKGFEKAVTWCRDNRLHYHQDGVDYYGWSSGGDVDALAKGMPESWATAVVHMFLYQLESYLAGMMEKRLISLYQGGSASRGWGDMLDSDVTMASGEKTTAKTLLEQHLLSGLKEFAGEHRSRLRHSALPRSQRRSVLVFGPPGTSKTTIVRAFAQELQWPFIEVTPSAFLEKGLPEIYTRSNEIFRDITDLSGVIVLFDEMDALGRSREVAKGASLDITSQFLTTSMLPKLATLHDSGKVVYFMLTNHRGGFDPAITRPGRFDLLLFLGPPSWSRKLDSLPALLGKMGSPADLAAVQSTVRDWTKSFTGPVTGYLDRFTVDEVKALFESIVTVSGKATLIEAIKSMDLPKFAEMAERWATTAITLHDNVGPEENTVLTEYKADLTASKLQ